MGVSEAIISEYEMNKRAIEALPGNIKLDIAFFTRVYDGESTVPEICTVNRLRILAMKDNVEAMELLVYIQRGWESIESFVGDFEAFNANEWEYIPGDLSSADRKAELFGLRDYTTAIAMREHLEMPEVWAMLAKRAEMRKVTLR